MEHKVWRHLLKREIPLYNIDGTKNRAGSISEFMRLELTIGDYVEVVELLVTDLGPEEVILGLPWLRKVNPDIDWKAGLMNIRVEEEEEVKKEEEEVKKEEEEVEEQYQRIIGNHQQRRKWWKEGILEDTTDELWVAAGLDVRWGYNNVWIREGDEWKVAFVTNRGLFKPQVMFFGLMNSPATFQAPMNSIFADLIAQGKVAMYLDDILIYSTSLEEHHQTTHEVLKRLQENDLYLHPEKCEFDQEQVEYLDMVICEGVVSMDPVKVRAVKEWATPRNLRELRGFLGFANFYQRFIKNFSKIAHPLNDLTKKDCHWEWGIRQRQAFEVLKEAFTKEPILVMWDPAQPTRLEVDASGYATGGVILQQLEDGLWHLVAYRSESMAPAEQNYEIYNREMLTII
uniref:Putative Gag protein n=1 Tax=Moniliophthora roreri TaxID=221103 RepID=A0A0W0GES2_MONRR